MFRGIGIHILIVMDILNHLRGVYVERIHGSSLRIIDIIGFMHFQYVSKNKHEFKNQ